MDDHDLRNAPSQFARAFQLFTNLIQGELKLAKAEISQNISRAGMGVAFFAIAAILALVALNVLAGALVAAIAAAGMSAGWAALLVGGVLLVIAVVLVFVGKSRLSANALRPSRTISRVETDIKKIKEATNA